MRSTKKILALDGAGGAEGAGGCTPADAGAKMPFVFPIRHAQPSYSPQ